MPKVSNSFTIAGNPGPAKIFRALIFEESPAYNFLRPLKNLWATGALVHFFLRTAISDRYLEGSPYYFSYIHSNWNLVQLNSLFAPKPSISSVSRLLNISNMFGDSIAHRVSNTFWGSRFTIGNPSVQWFSIFNKGHNLWPGTRKSLSLSLLSKLPKESSSIVAKNTENKIKGSLSDRESPTSLLVSNLPFFLVSRGGPAGRRGKRSRGARSEIGAPGEMFFPEEKDRRWGGPPKS